MKYILSLITFIVFFATDIDCYGADDSGSVKRMSTISRDGLMIIEYGVDSKHQIKDVIFREANNKNLTLEMVPDDVVLTKLNLKIIYNKLLIDGPCACEPIMVCAYSKVRRLKMKPIDEKAFLDIVSEEKSFQSILAKITNE